MKIFENGKFYLEKGRFCEAVLNYQIGRASCRERV